MALVECKECKESVSDKAAVCPKCGATIRKPKRTVVGKIALWLLILFNVLMAWWLFSYFGTTAELVNTASSSAEQAGAAVGTGIGTMFILVVWCMGDIILGLFAILTRAK